MTQEFDPSGIGVRNGNFLGLPYSPQEADIVILPLPWDVTTSYREGTSSGPEAVIEASYQIDLTSPFLANAWQTKIGTLALNKEWREENRANRAAAKKLIEFQQEGGETEKSPEMTTLLKALNAKDEEFHVWSFGEAKKLLQAGKKVVALGGDHSVSFGPIRALAEAAGPVSILHIDAHADLREAYEGFPHSHASIMYLVKDLPGVKNIVQLGIRDYSPDEKNLIADSHGKISTFFDWEIQKRLFEGGSWKSICGDLIEKLGPAVYLSFDIDGLDPRFCPNTGTPVPGGLDLNQVFYLLNAVVESGRKLVGADLVEVAPGKDEWDANVGARTLFQICQLIEKSRGL